MGTAGGMTARGDHSTVTIQAAALDQSAAIQAVIQAAFEQYREQLDPPSSVFRESAAQIRSKLEAGGGFIACAGEDMVGAVLYEAQPDYMYLGRLAVLPAYRGQGIANRLVQAVEQAAIQHKLPRVELAVRIALSRNQAFFQHMGYAISAYHAHEGYSVSTYVSMQKSLSSR